jgi:RNA polymerase sigma-70 factor (ECF subfamily)
VRSRIFRAREAIDARMRPLLDHDELPKRSKAS